MRKMRNVPELDLKFLLLPSVGVEDLDRDPLAPFPPVGASTKGARFE